MPHNRSNTPARGQARFEVTPTTVLRDLLGGSISATVTIAYCISFSALIFQGAIASGFPLGLSALLMGSAVTGLIVALTTTLAPADAGPDTPAIAVMSVLAGGVAASFADAGGGELAAINVMMAITISTLLTGLLLLLIGGFRMGLWLRFVPYPVIGGFLAASGWLLITGGIEVMTGTAPALDPQALNDLVSGHSAWLLAVGLIFAVGVFALRQRIKSFFVLPTAFFLSVVTLDVLLLYFGVLGEEARSSWFISGFEDAQLWVPVVVATTEPINWMALLERSADIGAVCGVTAISMLLDVSSLEVARSRSADLDKEFRSNGIANVLASLMGGVAGNLSLNGSILIQEAGAVSRLSGVFAAIICGIVLFFGADLASLIPKALLGGLLAYLGLRILQEALFNAPAQRSWTDHVLALAIMVVIVSAGYLMGVVLGILGACLTFAFSYSRIGVVRRHLTRAEFSSNVDRSQGQTDRLREHGRQIHILWLRGFIFFGSSNGLFEYIRRCIEQQTDEPVRFIVLDFGSVEGLDTSALLSLIKLKNYCAEADVRLNLCGLNRQMRTALVAAGFFAEARGFRQFDSRDDALAWCENEVLGDFELAEATDDDFEDWLAEQIHGEVSAGRIIAFLDRHEATTGEVLYEQGSASDSLELVAAGCVAIVYTDDQGRQTRLRRVEGQTVVGEMGFFRGVPRGASVIADAPTVLYRLSDESFEEMNEKDPAAAAAFHRFIIKVLSDRLDFANREIAALV